MAKQPTPGSTAGYRKFLRESKERQRQYIENEQRRMAEAGRLWRLYQAAMLGIDLHPLSIEEIIARQAQLRRMLDEIDRTHGDTEGQRAVYEMRITAEQAERAALAKTGA